MPLTVPLRTLALLICLVVMTAVPAHAHEGGDPTVQVVRDELPPELDGIQVQVAAQLSTQLVLSNPTDQVVEVIATDGRPFLRIGPDGVEANVAVADWYTTNDPFGTNPVPDDIGGPDDWRTVALEPTWGWYDHRLHPSRLTPPQTLVQIGEPADFGEWVVPVTVDGDQTEITGHHRFQPVRGGYAAAVTDALQFDDVVLAVLPAAVSGLTLENRGDAEVAVLGAEGEPFLRIGPDGVRANVRSPAWLASARARDGQVPTAQVDPTAEPRWELVADDPRFSWVDPRINPTGPEPSRDVIARAEPAEVLSWEIPLAVGDQTQAVGGTTTWQPAPGLQPTAGGISDGSLRLIASAAVSLLAVGGLALTRRQRRPGAGPT